MKINVLERINGKMQSVTREMTDAEIAEMQKMAAAVIPVSEPTEDERISDLEDLVSILSEVICGD